MTKFKEVAGAPRNRKFYALFHSPKGKTRLIGVAGQVISGATSAVAVFALAGGLDAATYSPRWILAAMIGAAAAWLFQVVGVRAYLVRIIRQATRREFHNWKWWAMLALNLTLFAAIFSVDLATSMLSRQVLLPQATEAASAAAADSAQIVAAANAAMLEQEKTYEAQRATIRADHAAKVAATTDRAKEDVKALERSLWGETVTPAQRAKTKAAIIERQKQLDNDLAALQLAADQSLREIDRKEAAYRKNTCTTVNAQLSAVGSGAQGRGRLAASLWGWATLALVIAGLTTVISIVYEEIYFTGSEVDFEIKESDKQNLFVLLFGGLYDRIYYALEGWIYALITPKKPAPIEFQISTPSAAEPRPQMGFFNHHAGAQPIATQKVTQPQAPQNAANKAAYKASLQAMREFRKKYRESTVKSWYDRSQYAPQPRSSTPQAIARNTAKYEAVKREFENKGVTFIEGKTLQIKF